MSAHAAFCCFATCRLWIFSVVMMRPNCSATRQFNSSTRAEKLTAMTASFSSPAAGDCSAAWPRGTPRWHCRTSYFPRYVITCALKLPVAPLNFAKKGTALSWRSWAWRRSPFTLKSLPRLVGVAGPWLGMQLICSILFIITAAPIRSVGRWDPPTLQMYSMIHFGPSTG